MPLGSLSEVTLARHAQTGGRAHRSKGVDPIAARRQEGRGISRQSRQDAQTPVTLREAAEARCDENAPNWKRRYAGWTSPNSVVRYAYPAIAARAVDAIEVERIRAVIRATSEVLSVTLRVRRRIEAILDDATEGLAEFENEADDGKQKRPTLAQRQRRSG